MLKKVLKLWTFKPLDVVVTANECFYFCCIATPNTIVNIKVQRYQKHHLKSMSGTLLSRTCVPWLLTCSALNAAVSFLCMRPDQTGLQRARRWRLSVML